MTKQAMVSAQPKSPKAALIIITVIIALVDLGFVSLSVTSLRNQLDQSLQDEGRQLRSSFMNMLDQTGQSMMEIAAFVANDPENQSLFNQGRIAVEAEGGGAGGVQSDAIRSKLYMHVAQAWTAVQTRYQARQLQFHLGPGSTSFLRVHRPEKFGDNMDQVRHTVVAVNRDLEPVTGFETGRVYSGIRGVVPVTITDPITGTPNPIGAVEAGTSFQSMLETLTRDSGFQAGVMLSMDHIESAMWPEKIDWRFGDQDLLCGCVVEAQTHPLLQTIIEQEFSLGRYFRSFGSGIITVAGGHLMLVHFPIRDFLGTRDPTREPVGAAVFWRDATGLVQQLEQAILATIIYGIVGFIIVEALVLFGIRRVSARLGEVIADKTRAINHQNQKLSELLAKTEHQAVTDYLTEVSNRGAFTANVGKEISRLKRKNSRAGLIILDIDDFKTINDRYGHAFGDEVLRQVAGVLQSVPRSEDLVGRIGGEEFAVLAIDADIDHTRNLAERIRQAIADLVISDGDQIIQVTVSIGIERLDQNHANWDEAFRAADQALYKAKNHGKNRVVSATPFLINKPQPSTRHAG